MSPVWQKYSGYTVWRHNLRYIFTKFFDIRHLHLLAVRECQAGVGLCPVTWITMNHMQYWSQWHFKSLLAIDWISHSAWMNKRGRMEGGREGRWNSGVGTEEGKAESIELSLCGAKTQLSSRQWISDTVSFTWLHHIHVLESPEWLIQAMCARVHPRAGGVASGEPTQDFPGFNI